jgi:antirestriction protein ArdC
MPRNLISNKEYRGINTMLLGCQKYNSPYWLTFKQATERGGHVKQGEKSSLVVFWNLPLKHATGGTEETDSAVTPVPHVTSAKRFSQAPLLRYYNLFNLEQCEGIAFPPQDVPTYQFTPIEKAEQIVSGMKDRPEISYGGNRASYSPVLDKIRMPYEERFAKSEEFYSVLFHELGHSTGHCSRLSRKEVTEYHSFGSAEYSAEELVAEFCASFLCGVAGISNNTIELNASYIDGWMTVLKKDRRLLVTAAAQAQKAADYILGKSAGEEGVL